MMNVCCACPYDIPIHEVEQSRCGGQDVPRGERSGANEGDHIRSTAQIYVLSTLSVVSQCTSDQSAYCWEHSIEIIRGGDAIGTDVGAELRKRERKSAESCACSSATAPGPPSQDRQGVPGLLAIHIRRCASDDDADERHESKSERTIDQLEALGQDESRRCYFKA